MLSTPSKYALKALMYLAECEPEEFVPVPDVAENARVPAAYLSKILKTLVRVELLDSRKGVNGGIKIRKKTVSFYEVCEALDDPIVTTTCLLNHSHCRGQSKCEFHDSWQREREKIHAFLKRSKLKRP